MDDERDMDWFETLSFHDGQRMEREEEIAAEEARQLAEELEMVID